MGEAHLRSPSEGLIPDDKSDGGLSDSTLCGSLWDQAIQGLDKKQKSIISDIRNSSCNPKELLDDVNKEVEKCKAKQWSIYTTRNGRRIFLRDVLSRIAGFLQKVTTVGDALAQYDPGHLTIPWAFARFLLIAAVSDINSYGSFLESMEIVTDTISRYVIVESIYLQPGLDCTSKLETAIVSLYTAILKYLCKAKLYFGHNTMVRVGISILKVEQDAAKLVSEISSEEEIVEKWLAVNRAQLSFRTYVGVGELTDGLKDFRKVSDERALKLQNTLLEMQKPVCRIANQMDYIYSSIESSEKNRIIKWISSLGKDYEKNHGAKARYRLINSGQWLLRTHKYRHWLNSSSCSVLWLHGGAGYGKSFLVSLVVDLMLQERQANPHAAYLAYFYCTRDTAEPKRAQPVEILRSIIRQLSCLNSQTPIRTPIIEKWNERVEGESDHGLDMDECVSVLLDLTRDNPAIICIDALDECDLATRRQLLDAIGTVINCSEQIVKVFVSSRREDDFLDYFEKWEALEISAKENREDIINFIDAELTRITDNKTLLHGKASKELISDIRQVLLDGADGMFRWVSACLQTLCDHQIVMEEEVRDALGKLPKELKDVYDIICSQIERRTVRGKMTAENVLKWLLYANQPLSCNEMIKASTTDPKSTITKEQVLSLCCNFVKLDEEIGAFQFVHLSVREYLENRPEFEAASSHATIAQSCLQACLMNMKPKRRANLQNLQNKTFYDYAQVYWPLHCQLAKQYRCEPHLETSFRKFLCTGKFPSKQFRDWVYRWSDSWSQMDLDTRRGAEMGMMEKLNECDDVYQHANPIFVACVFGFTEVVNDRRQAGMAVKDSTWRNNSGRDPYEVAIRYGQQDVINILRSTTSLDSAAARESALLSAVSLGEMAMVNMLLKDHSDLEITDEIIAAAAGNCDVEMMQFLADQCLDFRATEHLVLIAASNESHGQHIVRFLFDEGGDEIEDIDKTALLTAACRNGPCGLDIVQFIIDNTDEISISDEVLKAAAQNQFDAYQILRSLSRLDKNITITEEVIQAAARNQNAEPIRFLISRFPSAKVTWNILNAAARNVNVGHTIMTILLGHNLETKVDEDLLLAAVANEKLGDKLLEVLLPRIPAAVVTTDVLKAAAQNRFFGHGLVEVLLKQIPGRLLDPVVIQAGSRNPYYAPEVVKNLLEYDNAVVITTASLEEAAVNNECGVETLELLFGQMELNSKLSREDSRPATDSDAVLKDALQKPFVVPQVVVEAAASNSETGTDIMRLLLKWSPNIVITPKAVENAAGNSEFGEEIITLWTDHGKQFEVSTRAVERAAGNPDLGLKILTRLLRLNKRVTITDDALEIAASNPYYGFQMVKLMMARWKNSDGFEGIVSRAARNAQGGHQIIAYLLKQQKGSVTSDVIEACAASPFADKEMMTILLNAAPGIPLGVETVEASSNRPQHFFDILEVLRAHDPSVSISNAAMYNVVRMSFNIIETIKLLRKYHERLTITEALLKSVARNINANEATITFLCEFQKEQSLAVGTLPVTEEVLAAGLRNSGNGAVSMVKRLLAIQASENSDPEKWDRRLEAAVQSYRAEAMIPVLVQHAQQHQRSLKITLKALQNAARSYTAPKALNILLKLLPESGRELINNPEVLKAAAGNISTKSQLKLLISQAATWNMNLHIDQTIFEQATKGPLATMKLILNYWVEKGQFKLIQDCVTEKVLELAATNMRFRGRTAGTPEQSAFHFLFRMRTEQGLQIPLTGKLLESSLCRANTALTGRDSLLIEYFQRIIRRLGGDIKFEDLITTGALSMASNSFSEQLVSQFLDLLPEEKRDQLLTRDVLLAAAGGGFDGALKFLLQHKDFQQYSKYYEDISKFHKATWSIFAAKQRILLRQGVYPNAPMLSNGFRPLSIASCYNELPSVRTFMKFPGFDLDAVDPKGRTALHLACEMGAETIVELLLARGADKTIKDEKGMTAEDWATENYHYAIARMVRDYDAGMVGSKRGDFCGVIGSKESLYRCPEV